jgi:hypothetical protein
MTECILWTGYIQANGYGKRYFNGQATTAHAAAYIEAYGPLPDEPPPDGSARWEIHHRCETRACVNLEHLEVITAGEHQRRHPPKPLTHCKHGHALTPDNLDRACTYQRCLTCKRRVGREADRRRRSKVAA